MPNSDKVKLSERIFIFFKEMARHPFLLFLMMLAIAASAAGWIFLNFNQIYLEEAGAVAPAAVKGGAIFDRAKADKYREIFSIIKQREKEYNGQGASTTRQ